MLIRLMALLALIGFPTRSDARPGKTCSQVCRRAASCEIFSYDLCMKMCGDQGAENTPESRAQNLAQSKLSCSALAEQLAPSQWLCTAEGASAYGYDMDTTSPDVQGTQDIYILGMGKTRSAAVNKAINDCNSIMTAQLAIEGSGDSVRWGSAVASGCHITKCIPPASARKNRQG